MDAVGGNPKERLDNAVLAQMPENNKLNAPVKNTQEEFQISEKPKVQQQSANVTSCVLPADAVGGNPKERLDNTVLGELAKNEPMDAAMKDMRGKLQVSEKLEVQQQSRSTADTGLHAEAAAAVPHGPEQKPNGYIMISYCWDNKKLVRQVHKAITEMGVKVWIDENEMHGSIIERMAEAVSGSQAIVMCYSQGYFKSFNCRSEAEYARKCKKPIIPVLCQEGYTPGLWLDFILGSMLYYDLSTPQSFEENMPGLLKEVKRHLESS